jgi:hypothetical protein
MSLRQVGGSRLERQEESISEFKIFRTARRPWPGPHPISKANGRLTRPFQAPAEIPVSAVINLVATNHHMMCSASSEIPPVGFSSKKSKSPELYSPLNHQHYSNYILLFIGYFLELCALACANPAVPSQSIFSLAGPQERCAGYFRAKIESSESNLPARIASACGPRALMAVGAEGRAENPLVQLCSCPTTAKTC